VIPVGSDYSGMFKSCTWDAMTEKLISDFPYRSSLLDY